MPLVRGQARTRRLFDWLAPRYDLFNAVLFRPEWRRVLRNMFLEGRVLDVGVGTGVTTNDVPRAVGIDLSPEMISPARGDRRGLVPPGAVAAPFPPGRF